ncbi:MAG: 2-oxo acid dehydrogenase subunit E2, partial [Clostridiales bacterium]|nr:2-oxo acid dehydrogenase subunit E2 [Clostridiales bacterium]
MFGFRPEGRRVKHLDPIIQATPYLMPMRCDAQVFLHHDVEYEPLMRYIADKSRNEGVRITFLEVIIACYIRAVSQVPEVNRFIMNKQYYNRKELTCAMTILMNTDDGSIKENVIKVKFDPTDTIYDVAVRLTEKIDANRTPDQPSFAINLASFALGIPGFTSLIAGGIRLLDRYGLLPGAVIDELPFHTSMFITNNASIGLHSVYHHIYNFGNTGMFFGLGTPERGFTVDAKGNPKRWCTLPIGITVDERVCGGAMYARLFTWMKRCLRNPEMLDHPPEKVFYNEGAEYHVP